MKINRHQIREFAFQTLFAMQSNHEENFNLNDFFKELSGDNEAIAPEYYQELVDGVQEHKAEIDKTIESFLDKKWSLGRLNKSDLIILEIAIYEMNFVENVPAKVAINEALELSKNFSDDKSITFINAILDKIMKKSDE